MAPGKLDASIAILNGAIGDYLARTGNGLATPTALLAGIGGMPLRFDAADVARAFPEPRPRLVVLLHGLMCTETAWRMEGGDYGVRLAADLGFAPLYVRYNTGMHLAESGASVAVALEAFVAAYSTAHPGSIDEIVLLGHSMGGLVARAACHAGHVRGDRWLPLVRRAIYLGTPHLGAPLERAGRFVARVLRAVPDPYARLVAEIGDLRSAGIKGLGEGFRDPSNPIPLLPEIEHCLVAGSLSDPWLARLFGDALVPLSSATNGAPRRDGSAEPPGHLRILSGVDHVRMTHDQATYECIRAWCARRGGDG